jgi:hypothetical protein
MGSPATFLRAGFRDVTPPGQTRLVMRYVLADVASNADAETARC